MAAAAEAVASALLYFQPMKNRFVRSSLIGLFLALSACGKGFAAKDASSDAQMTGARNKDGLEYTGAADSDDLEKLKQAIDPTAKANIMLADSVDTVEVLRFDAAGTAVTKVPAQIEVHLKLQTGAPLIFRAPLSLAAGSREARQVVAKGSDLKLHIRCLETDCGATEIRFSNSQQAEAGLIYRIRHVKAEALGPFRAASQNSRLSHLSTLIGNVSDPVLLTTEVAWGPASFVLQAGDIQASGDLVATGGDEENVSVVVKNDGSIDGRLLGNSNHGDLLLRLSEGASWSFLRLRLPQPVVARPIDSGDDATVSTNERFIPYDLSNPITAAFQKDKNHPVIQSAIAQRTTGPLANDLKQFLNRLQPNLSQILPAFAANNVPPEFVFILLVESNYFVSTGFPVSVSSVGAVGPWQFMPATAKTYGLLTLPLQTSMQKNSKSVLVKQVTADKCDARANIEISSTVAAKYFRRLLNMFPNDPKLAIMAYNLGENGLARRLTGLNQKMKCGTDPKCAKSTKRLEISDFMGLDYWDVRDFNVAPKESINYVPRFLAAQFVGREPSRYGLKVAPGFPISTSTCH